MVMSLCATQLHYFLAFTCKVPNVAQMQDLEITNIYKLQDLEIIWVYLLSINAVV